MRLVFIGPPGVGKGTQCRRVARHLGVPHISTGDMLRGMRGDAELGTSVRQLIDQGRLVPDAMAMDLLANRLRASDAAGGWVLDGFPRTVPQAEMLDAFLRERAEHLMAAVVLGAPREVLLDRLVRRQQSESRDDDDLATIERRLQVYRVQTQPVIDYYGAGGRVKRFDATSDEDSVYAELLRCIEES